MTERTIIKIRWVMLTVFLLLLPLAALAESFTLHSYKHWRVEYLDTTAGPGCRAMNEDPTYDIAFFLTFDKYGLDINLYDGSKNYDPQTGILYLWVDNRTKWKIEVDAGNQFIWADLTDERLINELRNGQRVYFDISQGGTGWDYWFSLQGSSVALSHFADCIRKMPTPNTTFKQQISGEPA